MTHPARPDSASVPLYLPAPADTAALGARLCGGLAVGDVVFLNGDLGAGKTTLARGLINAWTESPQAAPSPSYTLVQTYEGPRGELWHLDLYRLAHPDEVLELGLEDAYETALVVIEWPKRMGPHAPARRLDITLRMEGQGRTACIAPIGGGIAP